MNKQMKALRSRAKSDPMGTLLQVIDELSIAALSLFEPKVQDITSDLDERTRLRANLYMEFLYYFSHRASRRAYSNLGDDNFEQFVYDFRKQEGFLAQERLRLFFNELDYARFPLAEIMEEINETDNFYGKYPLVGTDAKDRNNVISILGEKVNKLLGEKLIHLKLYNEGLIGQLLLENRELLDYISELVDLITSEI